MNIIDAIIILILLMGAVIGFKQGAIKKTVSFVGTFAIIIIAFMFKNDLSVLFYENLPFFDFWGAFKGIQVLNIILYEIIAFLVVFSLLFIVLRMLIVITGFAELLLKATIFLAIPSKILGIFVGLIEYYVYVFIVLFVISLPVFNLVDLNESKFAGTILNNTPLLSGLADDTVEVYTEVYNIIDNRGNKSTEELNEEVLTFMLDKKAISYESAKSLIDQNKVFVKDKEFIETYK